jgi:SAM-dependent methyltransferase
MSANDAAPAAACFLCRAADASLVADIRRKPIRETDFGAGENYSRQVYRCRRCDVYFNLHRMFDTSIYADSYNQATYQRNLRETYERIRNLPEEKSDNKQRVRRIVEFNNRVGTPANTSVLDVGGGTGVFLGEMKDHGFYCYAIDPDELSTRHALDVAGVDGAHTGTLEDFNCDRTFDIISFNKVLEHVPDPVRALTTATGLLSNRGVTYIELPDADGALSNGDVVDREEFYVEHFTIFTAPSLEYLANASGLRMIESRAIHEPSDKYTLYAFLERANQ